MGRPTDYTPEISDLICAKISEGISIRSICEDEAMPCAATVFNWMRTQKGFLEHYERAKEAQADALAEDILDIADDGTNDFVERKTKKGTMIIFDKEHVQRSRLRVDARKWIASKFKSKRYGDKVEVAGDPNNPVGFTLSFGNDARATLPKAEPLSKAE